MESQVEIGDVSETPVKESRSRKRTVPKWEAAVRSRIVSRARSFQRPLNDLINRHANEGDTRLLVTDFLCDCLGYDKYTHLTTEYRVKGEFADYGISVDGEMLAFVEVKRVGTKLTTRHLRQVEMYAVNEGAEWIILTNGAIWQVYHLSATLPMEIDLVFEFDLTSTVNDKSINELFYLSLESFKRNQIDTLWNIKRATSPSAIAQTLMSDAVLAAAVREIRKNSGHKVSEEQIRAIFGSSIARPECL